MARKATRKRAPARKRSRARARKRTATVALRRKGVTVYRSNPRRRHRRRGYHRNPALVGQVKQLVMDTALLAAGGAVQRGVSKVIPVMSNPLLEAAKGTAIAVGVGMLGRRFVGNERARYLAAGAMLPVLKNIVTAYVPSAAAFLGEYEPMSSYSPLPVTMGDPYPDGGYLAGAASGSMDTADAVLGSYEIY